MIEVNSYDLSYTTSCGCFVDERRRARAQSCLSANCAAGGEFRHGADPGLASCPDAARTTGGWADRLPQGRAEDRAGAGDAMAASGHGDAGERERARPGAHQRPGAT